MILKLAAEDFARCYGILILDDNFLIEIDHSLIPKSLIKELKKMILTITSIQECQFMN
ncbi:hypothetical protein GCM10022393_36320 [Aquimarina addita]|uniref:Uncharacterized protein n=1 Tax=Aquimarina addita TaxID=870485 RepID=A0ABP6UUZ8_9FLAO